MIFYGTCIKSKILLWNIPHKQWQNSEPWGEMNGVRFWRLYEIKSIINVYAIWQLVEFLNFGF